MQKSLAIWLRRTGLAMVVALTAASTQAVLVDPLDDTDNFFGHFGGATTVSTAPGEVTIFRNVANVDTGVDWQHNGASGPRLALSTALDEHVLAITPVTPVNGGFYTVQILFFDGPTFVSENTLIPDTNSTAPITNNIAGFAHSLGITATDYSVRFRIGPFEDANPGFTFTEIAAIPEPGTMAMVLGVGALLRFLQRKRQPSAFSNSA